MPLQAGRLPAELDETDKNIVGVTHRSYQNLLPFSKRQFAYKVAIRSSLSGGVILLFDFETSSFPPSLIASDF